MTLKMTNEIRQALSQSGSEPLRLVDSESNAAYVLIPETMYDRIAQNQRADELSETYAAQEAVAKAAGWEDPIMDEYNEYDARRQEKRGA